MQMTLLNQFIDELLAQSIHAEPPQHDAVPTAASPAVDSADEAHTARLRRVLDEMGQLLSQADLPQLDDIIPTSEALLRILNHWDQLNQSIAGIHQHMESLEADIARMQPWGDFDVMKVEQLASRGIHLRFWRAPIGHTIDDYTATFIVRHHVRIISHDSQWEYFVTIDNGSSIPQPVDAQPVEICPCPISTLIMLQTRDKDTLRRLETRRDDYALAHYSEVYTSLRQLLPSDAPMPQLRAERHGLRQTIARIFTRKGKS